MLGLNSPKISTRRIIWYVSVVMFGVLIIPRIQSYFAYIGVRWLYILLFSFSLSAVLTPLMRVIALKWNIIDMPGGRKIHEKGTPLLGGVAVMAAFTAALLGNMVLERQVIVLLCGGIIVASVGLLDDWRGVSARLKLLIQFCVVIILIQSGIVLDLFPKIHWWGYGLNILLTLLWIIGITNAMNFIDGMDGLAGGVAAIMSLFMGIVAMQTNQPFMGWIAIGMVGSCLGFLPYNFGFRSPAVIFLGDAGSTFIGFVLAALAIKGNWADNSRIVSFSAPVLIFWLLIYDMAYTTVERIVTGKVKSIKEWIDYVGTDHIHHRLYALLGDRRKAVIFIYLLCLTLGISAVALRYARPVDGILLVVQAFLITVIVSIAEYSGRNR